MTHGVELCWRQPNVIDPGVGTFRSLEKLNCWGLKLLWDNTHDSLSINSDAKLAVQVMVKNSTLNSTETGSPSSVWRSKTSFSSSFIGDVRSFDHNALHTALMCERAVLVKNFYARFSQVRSYGARNVRRLLEQIHIEIMFWYVLTYIVHKTLHCG